MLVQQNHADGGANGSIMLVVFVSCVFQVSGVLLAKSLPSEKGVFFVPA